MSSEGKLVLYQIPGLCSLAPHIALEASGLPYELKTVNFKDGKAVVEDGTDLEQVNPKKKIPALKLPDGDILTEGPVISQYIADQAAEKGLAPKNGSMDRYKLQEWLNFLTSEVHKSYVPIFHKWNDDAKQKAFENLDKAFAHLDSQLQNNSYLLNNQFTIADAYAYNLLRWTRMAGADTLDKYLGLKQFFKRVEERPEVHQVLKQEGIN